MSWRFTFLSTQEHMKNLILVLALVFSLSGEAFASGAVPGRVLAKPSAKAKEAAVQQALKAAGAKEIGRIPQINVRILQVPAKAEAKVIAALAKNPNFEFAEPDYIAKVILTPNDPLYSTHLWHLPKVSAPTAWDVTTGAGSVVVSIVDSGVDANHPDLKGRVMAGYDFANGDSDPSDDNGHGTAVAGTAAATGNNGVGVAGVAWGVSILPVKVMGANGSGSYSAVANGINYSADRGARVINLSLGGTSSSRTLESAVNYAYSKGSLLIAAAGNNGNSTPVYPAAYTNVVAVSALNKADTLPSWSNYGSYVALSAPGESITTTWPGNSYVTISGTSFSSPVVAGAAALALSVNPALSNKSATDLLLATADDLGAPGYDIYFGAGRVNAAKVTSGAAPVAETADTTAPVTAVTNPKDGASIAGLRSVNVSVSSSDNVAVTKAELYLNGRRIASSTSGSFTYKWNTSKLAKGAYQLQSKAFDAAGNTADSAIVTVYR
jgi:thermitase